MHRFSEQLLSRLSERIAEQMGLYFPRERWRELEAGIQSAAREQGVADAMSYGKELLAAQLTKQQIEALAGALTIGETYFFRDQRGLEILSSHVLPQLVRARRGDGRRLRMWSAGCCTGEEAYSLAILLDRLLPDLSEWQVTLLATDLNIRFLRKAAEGVFGDWSFRGAPEWLRRSYFTPLGDRRYALAPRIKEMVTFAYLNLGEDTYPALANNTNAMDLILCRNVLMYFAPQRAARVVRNFHRALVTNGWLMVSAVETAVCFKKYFATELFEGAVLYRKGNEAALASRAAEVEHCAVPAPVAPAAPQPVAHFETNDAAPAPPRESLADRQQPGPYATALQLFERGSYGAAAAILGRHVMTAPPDVDTSMLLARIHANLGALEQARGWAERAIAADKTQAGAHYLRAVILQEQSLLEEAHASLQRTLYLAPDFVLAHFALGNISQAQGKHAAATRHFANALALLRRYGDNDVLPCSDGMVAGRLREAIQSLSAMAGAA